MSYIRRCFAVPAYELVQNGRRCARTTDMLPKFRGPDSASLRPQVLCGVQSALGTGLNPFAGNVCVFMEPYANPSYAKQALKRLHRRGQTRDVYVNRLTCASEANGVLTERVLLHRAETRDIFAAGVFKTGERRGNGNGQFIIGNDEEEEGVDAE